MFLDQRPFALTRPPTSPDSAIDSPNRILKASGKEAPKIIPKKARNGTLKTGVGRGIAALGGMLVGPEEGVGCCGYWICTFDDGVQRLAEVC